jgi:hypothetical protein
VSKTQQRLGDWRVICARSGFRCWASETEMDPVIKMRVLRRFVDVQNPQDFQSAVSDRQAAPWSQPPGTDQFRSATAVTPSSL